MRPKAPPVIGRDWLTTDPIDAGDLRGRVSLLVFWSAGCEASLTRLLELDALSLRFSPSLPVVAVHTPRFAYERDPSMVADTIARVGLELPVVHDPELLTWARYNPGGWPAAVLIDHRGGAIGASLGLDDLGALEEAASFAVLKAERYLERKTARAEQGRTWRSARAQRRLPTALPAPVVTASSRRPGPQDLLWPSGLALLDGPDHRLAVVDSGNHRILIADLAEDARTATVTLSLEGLESPGRVCALDAARIAVSLPAAGSLVALDLDDADTAATVLAADLGRPQGMTLDRDGSLVVADAGDNQLLRISQDGTVRPIAGRTVTDGTAESSDGPAGRARLNQPVGVTRTQKGLAFTDAASSNLRLLDDKGVVRTVTSNDVQNFGLVDGPAHRASLQRPSALVTMGEGSVGTATVAIADTGNHRIRLLTGRRLKTLGLAGLSGPEDLVSLGGGLLIVADTGNHRLLVVDTVAEQAWELELRGIPPVDQSADTPTGPLVGEASARVIADVPYVGSGPWKVSVQSDPAELVEPLEVTRHERHPVSVALSTPGEGTMHIESAGPHPAERARWQRPLTIKPRDERLDR